MGMARCHALTAGVCGIHPSSAHGAEPQGQIGLLVDPSVFLITTVTSPLSHLGGGHASMLQQNVGASHSSGNLHQNVHVDTTTSRSVHAL